MRSISGVHTHLKEPAERSLSAPTLAFIALVALCTLAPPGLADDPQFRKHVNCKRLSDGNYVFGCSRFYSICTNGLERPMNCYDNLVLNPENNQCLPAAQVPICQLEGDHR